MKTLAIVSIVDRHGRIVDGTTKALGSNESQWMGRIFNHVVWLDIPPPRIRDIARARMLAHRESFEFIAGALR